MRQSTLFAAMAAILISSCTAEAQKADFGLKDALKDKFLVGTALNSDQILHRDPKADSLVKLHFNAIVAENCMKSEVVHPSEDTYNFELADKLVQYGEDNGQTVTGHCLIWHSQLPKWFCVDAEGKDVSPEVLKQRMRDHIMTVVGRYKGRILGWDVVNEAIMDDGTWRQSPFYRILGEEFIPWAFKCAHEADPDCELYYNDYNMHAQGKREAVVKLVKSLKAQGIRIDAVGMQGHIGMDYPDFGEFEKSMEAYIAAGVNVMITEWDMSALPTITMSADVGQSFAMMRRPQGEVSEEQKAQMSKAMEDFNAKYNPYPDGLPDSVSRTWNARMKSFLDICLRHADKVSRVTAWGVTDATSWKNNFPARRTDYPLLFDRNYAPKPFVQTIIDNAQKR